MTVVENVVEPVMTPETMIFAPRFVEIGQSTEASAPLLPFTIRDFSSDRTDTMNIYLHNINTMENKAMTRNPYGVKSLHPLLTTLEGGNGDLDHLLYLKQGKVWAIPLSGGESYILYEDAIGVGSFKVFFDGYRHAFLMVEMEVYPHMTPSETADHDAISTKPNHTTGVIYDQLMIRYWDHWSAFKKRNHLFTMPIEIDEIGRYKANKTYLKDIMWNMETDCPGKSPGNGSEDYHISSDGRYVAISCRKLEQDGNVQPKDIAWTTETPILLAALTPGDLLTVEKKDALTWKYISNAELQAGNANPLFSPDNKYLAFLSMHRSTFESDRYRISLYDIEQETLTVLTEDIDIAFQSLCWHVEEDGSYVLYAGGGYLAATRLFRLTVDVHGKKIASIEVMEGDESRADIHIVHGYLMYLESSLIKPSEMKRLPLTKVKQVFKTFEFNKPNIVGEVPVCTLDRPDVIQDIYCPNPKFTNGDLVMPEVQQFYFEGANGDMVHCWYMTPVLVAEDFDQQSYYALKFETAVQTKTVPLAVIIHGGPQGAILNNWNYRWNMATFASQGYAVVAFNFHGSTTFGEKFLDSINNDWGGKPFEDIMKGTDFILKQFSYLDPTRVAALGASYGGYMINWINGHTDRYKCLVNHDGVFSLTSQYYTTEELWFPGKSTKMK